MVCSIIVFDYSAMKWSFPLESNEKHTIIIKNTKPIYFKPERLLFWFWYSESW